MLPIPDPAESQPEYAIRFHTQMAQAIPRTDERNAKMLETWEKYGNEQERSIADGLFGSDQYEKRKNIAIFAEHETPRGDKYDQAALKAIAEKHNYRIRDTNTFSPITDGHTSDDPKHPKPATLGFSGPARLGMIGNENPRWAIFADEYQRKDAGDILKDSPGRSVEIWKHPNMADRFFYPIAALRVDAPRLDLPPARYAKAEGGDRVLVECYSLSETLSKDSFMMAAPGGNATFVPGGNNDQQQPDQYGDIPRMSPPEGEELPEDAGKFNDLMDAFMRTEFAQMALKLLEKEGQQVASPPISQPPDPAEMPYDSPHAQNQGQPGAGVSPSPNPAAPPAPPNAGPPMAAENPAPPMPPGAQGGPPNPPMPPGKDERFQMSEPRKDRYSVLNERLDALAEENKTLREQVKSLAARNAAQDRYSKLNELADEYQIDIKKELNRTEKYSAEQFDQHLEVIRENYSRRADAAVTDFATLAGAGMMQPFKKSASGELNQEDLSNIRSLCIQKGLKYDDGRELYMKEKAAKEHAPTVAS